MATPQSSLRGRIPPADKKAPPERLPEPACRLIQQISPGLLTQEEFIRTLESSRAIRECAILLFESKSRPKSIKRAQWRAWTAVLKAKRNLMRAGKVFDQMLVVARELMKESAKWERQDRELRERFIRKCERIRTAASRKEMAVVDQIRRRLSDKLLVQAKRVPVLRHAMLRRHSSLPIQAGVSERELQLLRKPLAYPKTSAAASSTATPNSAPPTERQA